MKTILIALLLSVSLPSSGGEDPNSYERAVLIEELCKTEGEMGQLSAKVRDEGVPASVLLDKLKKERAEMGEEYYHRYAEMVNRTYSSKLSPEYYRKLYWGKCMDRYRVKREMI